VGLIDAEGARADVVVVEADEQVMLTKRLL
jgi:hypothetical protein